MAMDSTTSAITTPAGSLEAVALLDVGLDWTAARIAHVGPDDAGAPTTCDGWALRDLLEHTLDTVGVFADAIDGPAEEPLAVDAGERSWSGEFADLARRIRRGWADPAAMDRTYEPRFGTMPGPVMAGANALEVVVHGWDIAQATGEAVVIPDELAIPILSFARAAITDEGRGDAFGPDLQVGVTPGEQLVAFLGRVPR